MSALGAPARESYASALWKRLKTQHVWLLPCYVKRADPFTRLRRTCCLVSAIGIHVLWMAMLVLVGVGWDRDLATVEIRQYCQTNQHRVRYRLIRLIRLQNQHRVR